MQLETAAVILTAVLPLYPCLFAIHQRIGRYDEVVEEFRRLQEEHGVCREAYHER